MPVQFPLSSHSARITLRRPQLISLASSFRIVTAVSQYCDRSQSVLLPQSVSIVSTVSRYNRTQSVPFFSPRMQSVSAQAEAVHTSACLGERPDFCISMRLSTLLFASADVGNVRMCASMCLLDIKMSGSC
jgi:hypothetical protein